MNNRQPWGRLILFLTLSSVYAGGGWAAMKVRVPGSEGGAPTTGSSPEGKASSSLSPAQGASVPGGASLAESRQPEKAYLIGTVVFVAGSQIVVEIPEGAKDRERFVVFDSGMGRRGLATVSRGLDKGVFSLAPIGSFSVDVGDRLARESENEAAYRVLRANQPETYREFLDLFPASEHKPRIARELFRLAIRSSYPTFPGTSVKGRLRLAETVGRELPLGPTEIVVDRFVIARTDEKGAFLIEGIPKLERPVTLRVKVRDAKFEMASDTFLELPGGQLGELTADLPVKLVPTVLAGRVLDARGTPVPGAEVWTEPYSVAALTDDNGAYAISRKKTPGGEGSERDEPLLGGDYQVYAHRKGFGVERTAFSAESFRSNPVPPLRLSPQDLRGEPVPSLELDLKAHLESPSTGPAAPEGGAPRLNP